MTGNEYQALAMRTNDRKGTERLLFLANAANKHGVEEFGGVLNGCLGLAGESGEVLDGYTVDFHLSVPRGISIDKAVDMLSEVWEEKINENCTSRV